MLRRSAVMLPVVALWTTACGGDTTDAFDKASSGGATASGTGGVGGAALAGTMPGFS